MTGTWSELLEYVARKPVTRRKGVDDGCRLWGGDAAARGGGD